MIAAIGEPDLKIASPAESAITRAAHGRLLAEDKLAFREGEAAKLVSGPRVIPERVVVVLEPIGCGIAQQIELSGQAEHALPMQARESGRYSLRLVTIIINHVARQGHELRGERQHGWINRMPILVVAIRICLAGH